MRSVVRIPRTSARNATGTIYAKILTRVIRGASSGFGFEGDFVRPNTEVAIDHLHLADGQTSIVVLECAGNTAKAWGHRRVDQLYLLWRCDLETGKWEEIGRALSTSWQWTLELAPIAYRALREARGADLTILPPLHQVAQRIAAALELEMEDLEPRDQMAVLAIVHDQMARRLACLEPERARDIGSDTHVPHGCARDRILS